MVRTPKDLMVVTGTLDGVEFREDLAELAKISGDLDGVSAAITDGVGRFAWWSTLETLATDREQTAKDALDALEADLMSRSGDGKVTVTEMKAACRRDPRWGKLHAEWRAAQLQVGMIRVGRKTVEERRDALKELADLLKSEMATGLERSGVRAQAEAAHEAMKRRLGRG